MRVPFICLCVILKGRRCGWEEGRAMFGLNIGIAQNGLSFIKFNFNF
jgi:hypothetical protein